MTLPNRALPAAVLALFLALPTASRAQGVVAHVFPHELRDESGARLYTGYFGWESLRRDDLAARFWQTESYTLLPSASISPGDDETALYTELAAVLSGAWRFSLSSTLGVTGGGETEEEPATPESDLSFRRFLTGGGNLAFNGFRPIAIKNQSAGAHVLTFVPRAWSNVTSLRDTGPTDDFGGEVGVEYQYHRYAQSMAGDTLGTRATTPFLTFHARGALAAGSSSFYETIGSTSRGVIPYLVPTLNLNFANGVRLGASYFLAYDALEDQRKLRIHLGLAPVRQGAGDR